MLGVPLIVVFTRAARCSAHNDGCIPFPNNIWHSWPRPFGGWQSAWGLGYIVHNWGAMVHVPTDERDFLFSKAWRPALAPPPSASYSLGTEGPFPAGHLLVQCRSEEWVELYLHSPICHPSVYPHTFTFV